ncbi:MAG: hypothetical protein PHN77_11080 [Thermoguttaceae bacterium]|jgi:hypothetical protein|nr:hypothetical protein [Thermoguttaceae bacterium]
MAACYWTGRISTDFGTAANWDAAPGGPAASRPPGPEDTGQFLSGGVDCLLSGDVTIGGLVTGPGYRGTIDLAGHNLAGSPAAGFLLAHSGDFVLGSGVLRVDGGTLGWAGLGGVLDRGTSTVHLSGESVIIPRSGDRLNDLLVSAEGDGATVVAIGPGTLGLANLVISSCGSSSVILNTAEHAPRLVVEGDLALVPADSSVITVEQSGAAPEWEIGGDVRVEGGRAGQVGWRCGSGTLTATGGRTQRWDWSLVAGPLEQIVIDKRWGSLVLAGSLACQGWTHRLGAFDPGGREIVCHGDLAIEPGGRLAADPGTMNGCSICVGGRLSIAGRLGARLRLRATSAWRLTVIGEAVARFVEVAHCDAAGGTIIDASDGTSIDGGENRNWRFADWPAGGAGNVAAAAVGSSGSAAGLVHSAGGPGQVSTPGSQRGAIHG